MIDELRKPFLRAVFSKRKPNEWNRLVGTEITRTEWIFLCTKWHEMQNKDNDFKRLQKELC